MGTEVSGSGAAVTEILERELDQRLLFQPLSYLIRTGHPDGQDLLGAANFAMMATNLLLEGKTGCLTAYRRGDNYLDLPLDVVTQPEDEVPAIELYDASQFNPRLEILWASRI